METSLIHNLILKRVLGDYNVKIKELRKELKRLDVGGSKVDLQIIDSKRREIVKEINKLTKEKTSKIISTYSGINKKKF